MRKPDPKERAEWVCREALSYGETQVKFSWKKKKIWYKLCTFQYYHTLTNNAYNKIPYGLAIWIPGFHLGGRGWTPGMGNCFLFLFNHFFNRYWNLFVRKCIWLLKSFRIKMDWLQLWRCEANLLTSLKVVLKNY